MKNLLENLDREAIVKYLSFRSQKINVGERRGLAVVLDITNRCNLNCRGCGVNAINIYSNQAGYQEISVSEAGAIFRKIRDYIEYRPLPFFLYIGGGEPFLHIDLVTILASASEFFGFKNISIDTNGTVVKANKVIEIENYVNRIGVSIDGPENYHNWWRNPKYDHEGFSSPVDLIRVLSTHKQIISKVEVSVVVTKRNLEKIPEFVKFLISLGVKRIFFHRAIPVGRLLYKDTLIPTARDYLYLLEFVSKISPEYSDVEIHLHNSLESIYINLFLGKSTFNQNKVGEPNTNSCIGIDPSGNVYFDPWYLTKPFSLLSGGNLLWDNVSLDDIIEKLNLFRDEFCSRRTRCLGCTQECSGGSRIAAASEYLSKHKLRESDISISILKTALMQIDPACFLSFISK